MAPNGTPVLKNLQALRQARGLSLRDLAKRSGVSHGSIYFLETRADRQPYKLTVAALAAALGVSVQDLTGSNPH